MSLPPDQQRSLEDRHAFIYDELWAAISRTREDPGVSIEEITKLFKKEFDRAEIEALIKELNK